MESYSEDLRERIIAARRDGDLPENTRATEHRTVIKSEDLA
jgi:hypothetical protein